MESLGCCIRCIGLHWSRDCRWLCRGGGGMVWRTLASAAATQEQEHRSTRGGMKRRRCRRNATCDWHSSSCIHILAPTRFVSNFDHSFSHPTKSRESRASTWPPDQSQYSSVHRQSLWRVKNPFPLFPDTSQERCQNGPLLRLDGGACRPKHSPLKKRVILLHRPKKKRKRAHLR